MLDTYLSPSEFPRLGILLPGILDVKFHRPQPLPSVWVECRVGLYRYRWWNSNLIHWMKRKTKKLIRSEYSHRANVAKKPKLPAHYIHDPVHALCSSAVIYYLCRYTIHMCSNIYLFIYIHTFQSHTHTNTSHM